MSSARSANRFVDRPLRHDNQLGVLPWLKFPKPCEPLLGTTAGATTQQSDCLFDDRGGIRIYILRTGQQFNCLPSSILLSLPSQGEVVVWLGRVWSVVFGRHAVGKQGP